MADAVIFFDGRVRQATKLSDIKFNNKTGFVTNFTFNKIKYTHVLKSRFISDGINTLEASSGYYDESIFLKYLAKDGTSIMDLKATKLNLSRIPDAQENDMVRVQSLRIDAPYADFCTLNKYSWKFDPKAKVLEDSQFTIILQPGYHLELQEVELSSVSKNFYNKNIGLVISSDFPIQDNKDQGAYYLSLIALQIHRINKDIFPLFSSSPELNIYITTQNFEWQTGTLFNQPTLQDFIDYYNNLTNFYNSVYANQLVIAAAPENTKIFWLSNCLSVQGLSVLSVYDKLYIITQAIKVSREFALLNVAINVVTMTIESAPPGSAAWIAKISPKLILRIIESVTLVETQSDDFLAELTKTGNFSISSDETLFEVIYNFLGDNQLGIVIGDNKVGRIVGGLFGHPDDRKNFISFLRLIWKTSIYNPYYESPKYEQPANSAHVFPESYYMSASGISHYNPDNATVLFVFSSTDTANLIIYTESFDFKIDKNKINAYQVLTETFHDEHPSSQSDEQLYGTYDFYQPVSLIGFKGDLDIKMPNENCIPLFFLYYANDYKQVKDADALIELVVNVALTFTGVGEVADLEYLGYLKQVSQFQAIEAMPASKVLLSWRAVRGINETVQLTAGTALAFSNYVNRTTTDPGLEKFTSTLNKFLGATLLGTICLHPIAKGKVTFAAKQVTEAFDNLPTELRSILRERGVTNEHINAVRVFADDAVASNIIKFSDNAELRDAILALDDTSIVRFLDDFQNIPDELLVKLKDSPEFVQYWSALSNAEQDAVNADKLAAFLKWYKNYVIEEAKRRIATKKWIDVRRSNFAKGKIVYCNNPEMETMVEIDIKYKTKLESSTKFQAGDGVATAGLLRGKSFDPMGVPKEAFETGWTDYPTDQLDLFKAAIKKHFKKVEKPGSIDGVVLPPLDYVVIDFKNFDEFDPSLRTKIMNFIFDADFSYSHLVTEHLIILN